MNDNRDYHYSIGSQTLREEYNVIADWIKEGSSVIDLGCGDGSLLALIEKLKCTTCEGRDISRSAVLATRKKGFEATVGRIDQKLPYKSKQFDYAICNVTLQMVTYPEILLSEMRRISKYQIIAFPNFAFILNRLELLFYGRMPQTMLSGYNWFDTGHIHQLSFSDFELFCKNNDIHIINKHFIYPVPLSILSPLSPSKMANLCATLAVFMTK